MKKHYDLNVQINDTKRWTTLKEYTYVAKRLNITGLGIDITSSNNFLKDIRHTISNSGIYIYSRFSIKAQKIPQIKHHLVQNQNKALIIAIETNDLAGCKWAIHDQRVDLISIDPSQLVVDKGLANLLKIHQKPVEIVFSPLFRVSGSHRSRLFRSYYKSINILIKKHTKLVLSSGAKSIFDLRGNRETMAIGTLLGLSKSVLHDAVSEIPEQIIQQKLEKIS